MIARFVYNPSFLRSAKITNGAVIPIAFAGVCITFTPRGAITLLRTAILAIIPTTHRGPIAVSSCVVAPLRTSIDRNVLTLRTITAIIPTAFCAPRCTTGDAKIRAIHRACALFSTRGCAPGPVASRGPARTAESWTTTGSKFLAAVTIQTIIVSASFSIQAVTIVSAPRLTNLFYTGSWFCCGN